MYRVLDVDPAGRITQMMLTSNATAAEDHGVAGRKVTLTPDSGPIPDLEGSYVDAQNNVVTRPALPGFDKTAIAADDTDAAAITGLPDPVTVYIDGEAHEVTGGTLTLTSAMPAIYTVEFRDADVFPYRPMTVEITAT